MWSNRLPWTHTKHHSWVISLFFLFFFSGKMSCSHNPHKLSKYSTVSHVSSTGWLNMFVHPTVTLKKTDKGFLAKSSQASSLLLQTYFFFCGQIIQSLSHLTIKLFSRWDLAWNVSSCKFQSNLKVLIMEQWLRSCSAVSQSIETYNCLHYGQ